MLLTKLEIASLLRQEPITDKWPWSTNCEMTIHRHIKDTVTVVCRKNSLLEKSEFRHYGSGYASFVDCWFYREKEDFRFDNGNCYWGLVVLFSTLSNYFVVGEGQKTWHKSGGSSYMPSFEFVDQIAHPATQQIAAGVCNVLKDRDLVRVYSEDLSTPLERDIPVPTILSDPPLRQFDALFYWED